MSQQQKRALLSVSDKAGIEELAKRLANAGWDLISTGGTARLLREGGLEVQDVSDVTGFPEMMDGRIKTLHPRVHGGLLALRDNDEHAAAMVEHDIAGIDLLVVNLYPFEKTVAGGADAATCIENIDIGGPAMIRAAAKNHGYVGVVTDPEDYDRVATMIEEHGALDLPTRRTLAAKAYAATAAYDSAIAAWLTRDDEDFPVHFSVAGKKVSTLRYGENPHQRAALYSTNGTGGVVDARQIQGKELSYNNLNDTEAAFDLIGEFDDPAVAIIKHANPCGVACANDIAEAYQAALRCDPVSAFGGIVAVNRPLDGALAELITAVFTEVVIAPDADEAALAVFAKKKNLRLLLSPACVANRSAHMLLRPMTGGFLLQSQDNYRLAREDLKIVTKRAPSEQELSDMMFAFRVAKHVKSNAIVYAKEGATVGVGAGQMSRLDSSRIAARKAVDASEACGVSEPLTKGSVVASDAFFPFADGMLAAAEAGATAVIQPGGSIRDEEIIAAADEAGLAMVFTGVRHFRH